MGSQREALRKLEKLGGRVIEGSGEPNASRTPEATSIRPVTYDEDTLYSTGVPVAEKPDGYLTSFMAEEDQLFFGDTPFKP